MNITLTQFSLILFTIYTGRADWLYVYEALVFPAFSFDWFDYVLALIIQWMKIDAMYDHR